MCTYLTPVHLALCCIHIFPSCEYRLSLLLYSYVMPITSTLPCAMHLHVSHHKDHPMLDHASVLYISSHRLPCIYYLGSRE